MKYNSIIYNDTVNSDGIGLAIFCQGCHHHCEGCFSPQTWNSEKGKDFGAKQLDEIEYVLKRYPYDNIVLLGGEPFDNVEGFMPVVVLAKQYKKKVWCYTGYTFEQLQRILDYGKLEFRYVLESIDILIDGRFEKELYNPKLKYRGSSNQRIIDLKRSLKQEKIFLVKEYMNN